MADATCSECGLDLRRVAICREANCPREQRFWDGVENARLLARDALMYGTTFTDVTGRRIDPAKIQPSNSSPISPTPLKDED